MERIQSLQNFIKEYHHSILPLTPMKKTVNQPPFFDTDFKQKTFFHKGNSYNVPMLKISLKILPDYVNEVKKLPGFETVEKEIEKLKQKARENRVEIKTLEGGGVEFYKKIYRSELLKKVSLDDFEKLYGLASTKKDFEGHLSKNKLHPETKKFLKLQAVKKLEQMQEIIAKALKSEESPENPPQKPQLRIVK